jgi:hypothetical protein
MAGTKLRVGAMDAGMVFRADGRIDVLMPRIPQGRDIPDNVFAAETLLWAIFDEKMFEEIVQAMEAVRPDARH